ncbi:MAG: phytoene desaturase family protein [Bacteroidota bacterium]
MSKKVIITGTGLGGLSTALRLTTDGYQVEMIEKYHQAGGRLNLLEKDGFKFDLAPTFFSMSYEFKELMEYCKMETPFEFLKLDPLYAVHFEGDKRNYLIYSDLKKLAAEFREVEPNLEVKLKKFLTQTGNLFHDTENIIIKQNFNSLLHYATQLMRVPLKHGPKMFYSMWTELSRHFTSFEVKVILSLVGFFLGSTPFKTPAVYTLLSYTELVHDGYHNVKGGMYTIVRELLKELEKRGVTIRYNTEIKEVESTDGKVSALIDQHGNRYTADLFVINADAASFRGQVLKREKFSEKRLDRMHWTMGPLTIYLGINGKVENMYHHNYFLRRNFEEYSRKIFTNEIKMDKAYYYVNIPSMHNPEYAPPGKESIFILCPVPELRYKPDWSDGDEIADGIIRDLGERTGIDFAGRTESRTVLTPVEWEKMFNLYKGSGLGLAHDLDQVGGMRPSNQDEELNNLFYVGASTTPGTGLPMVVISSRLVTERINKIYGSVHQK